MYWKEKSTLSWRFNLPVIDDNIEIIGEGLKNVSPFAKPTLFIRGELSNYIVDSDYPNIEETFTNSSILTIENSGHWVHAENPSKFLSIKYLFQSVEFLGHPVAGFKDQTKGTLTNFF